MPSRNVFARRARGATPIHFFVSSRRRHTRFDCDWSSDVCSSDLDSFSQSPELLREVAKANRFLGQCEQFLYSAKLVQQPQVALIFPRSSEIWGRATSLGITALEDAKWVYIALAHAHVPVDVLSEQQLAEG